MLQENVSLKEMTTFRVGGPARWFYEAQNAEEAKKVAEESDMPFVIVGGGSNILISDDGYPNLVIKIKPGQIKVQGNKIIVDSGVPLSQLVQASKENNLSGLEWASGIPGTVGGAVHGNAGAFQESIGNNVVWIKTGSGEKLNKHFCDFTYRSSVFKIRKDLIIDKICLQFQKSFDVEKAKEYLEKRRSSQPLSSFSAGCIFKNPDNNSAGKLIDEAGLKGKRVGGAVVSDIHANFIVNDNNATAKDIKELIELIKKEVQEKFSIELKEEIIFLGY